MAVPQTLSGLLVVQAYNPSFSGGRDQGIEVPSQAGQIVCKTLSQKKKKNSQKRAGGVAQGVGPEFKPQYHQKKKPRTAIWPLL
jgi:hypothetical protein